jgi:hypothetical protein
MKTIWMSFIDEDRPKGVRFLGVNVVDITPEEEEYQLLLHPEMHDKVKGPAICAAAAKAWHLGINPGGEVMAMEMRPGVMPEDMKNRLLTQADLEASGLVEIKNAKPCDDEDDGGGTERAAGDVPDGAHSPEPGEG